MQLLDEALSEVDTIEGKLSSYEEMLQSVKEQMDQISQSNRLIQISNTNNGKLLDEIQFLVVRMGLRRGFMFQLVWFIEMTLNDECLSLRTTWTCRRDTSGPCRKETSPPPKALRPVSMPLRLYCSA